MEKTIDKFITFIKEKTGVELSVYGEKGDFVCGAFGDGQNVPYSPTLFSDAEKGKTVFPITVKGNKFSAVIVGAGESEKKYALFISELADSFFSDKGDLTKEEFFKRLLLGEIGYAHYKKYSEKYSLPQKNCFAMIITLPKGFSEDVMEVLENYTDGGSDIAVKTDDKTCVVVKFDDKNGEDYRSAGEYAEFLARSVADETGKDIDICIGGSVKSALDCSQSYSQALSASRIKNAVGARGNIHSYKEFIPAQMIEDLPRYKISEYLQALSSPQAKAIFEDEEMVITAEEFLENNLNVSETSRKLFLHRNTLIYRLDKIEDETGLNIRKVSDAMTFRIITLLSKITGKVSK